MTLLIQIMFGLLITIIVLVLVAFFYSAWVYGIEEKEDEKRDPNFNDDDWWL